MAVKPPRNGTAYVDVDVHIRSNRPVDGDTKTSDTPGRKGLDPWLHGETPKPRTPPPGVKDLDAILPAATVMIRPTPAPAEVRLVTDQPLKHYWVSTTAKLPPADSEGFRVYNKRLYVDVPDGGIVLVAVQPDTGLYRARLSSELHPSGPLLLRDVDSGVWHPLNDVDAGNVPLTDASLQPFRTDLDLRTAEPGSDGLFRHDGKLYVIIHNHAYQAMQDLDASSPAHKVWRIVNPKDPVANDSANIYRASRSGETRAITRNEANVWVSVLTGLRGGMPRNDSTQAKMALLMQRYEPFQNAHTALIESSTQYDALWSRARQQADGPARTAALVAVEVHLLKHIRKQTAFVQSLVDNKDWMTILKAGGLFKEELHTFRIERVEYLNRLMAVMDLRTRPEVTDMSADNCRKIITHLNKKLKILDERQVVMEQIRKASPGAAAQLTELGRQVPAADRINFNKLALYVHLFADTPDQPPDTTMPSLSALDLITGDLGNVPEREHPMALLLAIDQLKGDRSRFEMLLSSQSPRSQYLEEIIALIDPIEKKIEGKLTEILDVSMRRSDLPSLDQDIDFDFIPTQPVYADTSRPAPAKKMFRTRQHGTYRVLVGETETAPDGSIIIKVPDPLRPDSPPRRYEKRQDEWLPVLPPIVRVPRSQLVGEAIRLLASHENHMLDASAQEARKTNPTEIIESLGKESDLLNEQARRLENHASEGEDRGIIDLAARLRTAADSLTSQGQEILVRMYKNKDVLDIMRLNYLLDRAELNASKTVDRKALGKGKDKSFLDVYTISDRADGGPLWQAHFHYDKQDSHPLNFTIKGSHLKTLEQSKRGIESQRRDELAGLVHVPIWRERFDGKTAHKIFTLADNAAAFAE
jgi:Tfp pilus assembly protein PilN